MPPGRTPTSLRPHPPGATAPSASGAGAALVDAEAVALAELRRLAGSVAPIDLGEAPPGREVEVATFNGAVGRFRELLVTARNQVVLGRPLPAGLELELRALSEALPGERRRAAGPVAGG
jgi:hypothetical protein